MFQHNWIVRSILITGLVIGYAQKSSAADFSSETFLSWKADSQRFYLGASIGMAGILAAQKNGTVSDCVDEWHRKQRSSDYRDLISTIREHSEYHPQGIILALLRDVCSYE